MEATEKGVNGMSKRFTSGLVAAVAAVAMTVPAVGLADRGGHPHSKKPCKTHRHYGKHRGKAKGLNFEKGKKCGFNRSGIGTTSQTGPTGPTGATGSNTSSTHRHHRS